MRDLRFLSFLIVLILFSACAKRTTSLVNKADSSQTADTGVDDNTGGDQGLGDSNPFDDGGGDLGGDGGDVTLQSSVKFFVNNQESVGPINASDAFFISADNISSNTSGCLEVTDRASGINNSNYCDDPSHFIPLSDLSNDWFFSTDGWTGVVKPYTFPPGSYRGYLKDQDSGDLVEFPYVIARGPAPSMVIKNASGNIVNTFRVGANVSAEVYNTGSGGLGCLAVVGRTSGINRETYCDEATDFNGHFVSFESNPLYFQANGVWFTNDIPLPAGSYKLYTKNPVTGDVSVSHLTVTN